MCLLLLISVANIHDEEVDIYVEIFIMLLTNRKES